MGLEALHEKLTRELVACCPADEQQEHEALIAVTVERVVRYHHRCHIREEMWGGLLRWILFGVPAGDFLQNMLKNNWMETFQYADEENTVAMNEWAMVVYNDVPLQCRGEYYPWWRGLLRGGYVRD